jgi:uncharacterized protein YndB with AHSA1/START domain
MDPLIVKDTIEIAAPAKSVWRVLTDPELTRKYMFGCAAVTDWKVGSPLDWTATVDGKDVVYVKGVVVAVERERLLSYTTIGVGEGFEDVPENYLTVTCRLTTVDGKTRLEITQGDYARVADGKKRYDDTVSGWPSVLQQMKALAESLESQLND